MAAIGLTRQVRVVVPSFPAVAAVVASSDLIGQVPRSFFAAGGDGTRLFALPVATPEITIRQSWHPRQDADPGHRWLRGLVFDAFRPSGRADTNRA